MSRVPPIAALGVGLLCACLLLGSGDRGRDPLRASLVPAMPREIAWHLVHDSDEDFTRYCDRVGYMDLASGIEGFRQAVALRDPERSADTYRALRPYWKRLAGQLERLYGVRCHARDLDRRDGLSVGDRVHLALLEASRDTLVVESRPAPRVAADSMQRIVRWADERGLELLALGATAALVDLSLNLGQPEESRRFMRDAIARARRCGDLQGLCQLLGRYPAGFPDSLRHTDSLVAMRVEALEIARSHRLIDQISRLLSFRANRERAEGRLVAAHDLLLECVAVWDSVSGSGQRMRAMLSLAEFYEALDCREAIRDVLSDAPGYLAELSAVFRLYERDLLSRRATQLAARGLIDDGKADSALTILRTVQLGRRSAFDRLAYLDLQYHMTRAARAAGQSRAAIVAADSGLAYCAEHHAPEYEAPFRLERARALLAMHEPDSAMTELTRVLEGFGASGMSEVDKISSLALASLVERERGRTRAASARLDDALRRMFETAARLDAGAAAYLLLAEPRDLAAAVQAECAADPERSYSLALAIGSSVGDLGRARRTPHAPTVSPPRVEARRHQAGWPRLGPRDVHILYSFVDEQLLRHTRVGPRVRLDTLARGRSHWHATVSELRKLLAEPSPGNAAARRRATLLRDCAEILPAEARERGASRRIYLTADGPLAALPFEALDLSRGETYEPLAARHDVAVLRGVRPRARSDAGIEVVARPRVGAEVRRRYPELRELPGAGREAREVSALWPEARVRQGEAATKDSVLAGWARARLIHVAAHLVRVPQIPYYDFVPLATPAGPAATRHPGTIEVSDIRRLDLSGCELVVLSTCASGVPYVARRRVGPSMADAFLDAGARAVLRTLRPVSDLEAELFTREFLREWKTNGRDAVAAASAARQSLFVAGRVDQDARLWSAWSVAVCAEPETYTARPAVTHEESPGLEEPGDEHGEHEGRGREFPSEYFFLQRARPDGTIPTERIAAAVEELQFERALREQQLGTSAAQDWIPIGPNNIGGRVNAIVAEPGGQVAYLGAASGGVWRTEDWGFNWFPMTDRLGIFSVGALAMNPLDVNSIWCGTGDANATLDGYDGTGLFVSRDRGVTWTYRGLRETSHIGSVVVDPVDTSRIYVGAMGKAFTTDPHRGFYRSLNGGQTWTRTLFVNDSTGVTDVVVNPAHPETIFCATWERVRRLTYRRAYGPGCGVWRSTDGGATWSRKMNGLPVPDINLGRITLAIAPSKPSRIYASVTSGAISGYTGLGVYRSEDGGENWVRVDQTTTHQTAFGGLNGFAWYFGHMAVSPHDADDLWIGGVRLLHSTDGGVILQDETGTAHVDHHALWVDPLDPSRKYLGNDGGFWWSGVNFGEWFKSTNLPISQFYSGSVDANNANKVLGGTQDNGTLRAGTGPFDWSMILGGDGFHALVDPTNTNQILAEWQYCSDKSGVKRSTTNGASWLSTSGWVGTDRYNWNTPIARGGVNPNVVLSGSFRVYRSRNAGANWTPISSDLTGSPPASVVYGTITTVAISRADSLLYLAGTDNGRVWRSQNAGSTWEEITTGLPRFYVTRVVTDPGDAQVVYVAHSGFGQDQHEPRVYRSSDRGTTWESITGNLPDAPVNDLVVDPLRPGTLYAGTDLGVFETRNLGETWVPLGGYMPVQPVWDLELHEASRGLYAFTHGRSVWKLDLNTVSLSSPGARAASGLTLAAPAPNPARASARLELALAARAQVSVIVFDAAGRRVRTLARGPHDAGRHPLAWDLRDERGARVRSGVFFVRASDGSATRTQRLVVAE